jgi:hypothetical protein
MMLCVRVLFPTNGNGGVLLLGSQTWYGIGLTDGNNDLAPLHLRRYITGTSVCAYSKAACTCAIDCLDLTD